MNVIRKRFFARTVAAVWLFALAWVLAGNFHRDTHSRPSGSARPPAGQSEWVLFSAISQPAIPDLPEVQFWPVFLAPLSFALPACLFRPALSRYQAIHESTKIFRIRVLQSSVSINAP